MENTKEGYGEYLVGQYGINFLCNNSLTSLQEFLIPRVNKQVSSDNFTFY